MGRALQPIDMPRVLIVEDEFLIALQLEANLIDFGCRVVGIMSDFKGLAGVAEAPDIALVDINLRDGPTGGDIACELSHRFGTTIIYVTANPAQITRPAPTAIGIVNKPFCPNALQQAISRAASLPESGALLGPDAALLPVFVGT
jgi:CheY-like chemotaxis protein